MNDSLAILRRFLTSGITALMAIGCLIYYTGLAIYDYHSGGMFARLPAFLFVVFVAAGFALSTLVWLRFHPSVGFFHSPEVNLPFGPVILLPVYFALLPPAVPSAEGTPFWLDLMGGYLILPVIAIAIQQTPMGWALDLGLISAILTGKLMRWLGSHRRHR